MLWIGKKLFKLRDKVSITRGLAVEDEEKPFLEHLEDLRKTIMKILVTLIVTMVACFSFTDDLVKIVNYPVQAAEIDRPEDAELPRGFKDPEEWPHLIAIAHGLHGLSEAQRQPYLEHAFKSYGEHLRPYLEPLLVAHAAKDLPEKERTGYLDAALPAGSEARLIAQDLLDKKIDVAFEKGPAKMRLWTSKPGEGFNMSLKLALFAGIVIAFPILLYFLLEFVVPGLTKDERKILWPSLAVGFGLFLIGVVFCYYVVTPNALRFFYGYDKELGFQADYRMTDYTSFVVQFTLIFGVAFELPVVVFALNKLGILTYDLMKRTRSYAVVIILIIAAIITPTADLMNLSLLAVPMLVLYEISIWIAYFNDRKVKAKELAEEEELRRWRENRRNPADAYLAADDHASPSPEAHAHPAEAGAHPGHTSAADHTSDEPDWDHGAEVIRPPDDPPFQPSYDVPVDEASAPGKAGDVSSDSPAEPATDAPSADAEPVAEPEPPSQGSTPGEPSGEANRRPDYP